jgi:outer membrane protein TolC
LTLQDALNLALDENPGTSSVADRIARARARVREVGAAVQPTLSAVGTFTRQGPISSFTITGPNGQPQSVKLGTPSSKTVAFNARKELDLSGQNRISKDIARRGITTAELDLAKAQNDLLLAVYNAYYGVLRADAYVGVQQEAIAAAQEQLRVADAQYRAGTLAEFDVLRAAVQVENLRQQLVTAVKNTSLARAQLLNAIGIDPNTSVNVEAVPLPSPPPVPPIVPTPSALAEGTAPPTLTPTATADLGEPSVLPTDIPLDLPTALAEAYDARPEVQNAANAVRTAERNVDLARRGKRPDVSLNGQYLFTPDVAGFSANKKSWSLNAQLNIPIFDGGLTRARVDESKSDVEAARNALEQSRQAVGLEVRTALLNLQEANRNRQTAAANVVQAREALRIAQVRFQAGVSTTVEVTDAQSALTQAQNNQVNADYDYLGAEAQLRRALGRMVPSETRTAVETKPGPPPPAMADELKDRKPGTNHMTAPPSAPASSLPSPLPASPTGPPTTPSSGTSPGSTNSTDTSNPSGGAPAPGDTPKQ